MSVSIGLPFSKKLFPSMLRLLESLMKISSRLPWNVPQSFLNMG